jgi:hypothetical protein
MGPSNSTRNSPAIIFEHDGTRLAVCMFQGVPELEITIAAENCECNAAMSVRYARRAVVIPPQRLQMEATDVVSHIAGSCDHVCSAAACSESSLAAQTMAL